MQLEITCTYVVDVKLLGDKYFVFSLIKYMGKEMVVSVKPCGNIGNVSIVTPAYTPKFTMSVAPAFSVMCIQM